MLLETPRILRHGTPVEDEGHGRNLWRFCDTKPSDYRWWGFAGHRSAPAAAFPASWQGRETGAGASDGAQ